MDYPATGSLCLMEGGHCPGYEARWWWLITKSYLMLWQPMACRTPGFPVLHCLEFAQIHENCSNPVWMKLGRTVNAGLVFLNKTQLQSDSEAPEIKLLIVKLACGSF